jgi:class 3 adenylate cyclase
MSTAFIIVAVVLIPVIFFAGYFISKRINKKILKEKRIEEYPFYPFITNERGLVEFSQPLFNEAVLYFLKNKNDYASKQLIIIGEQNVVRDKLATGDLNNYLRIYNKYEGERLLSENDQFMENYKRIVNLVGRSFKGTGIEILLHNLVNPTKSVIAIENGEVTGRKIGNGTTNLLLDLKTRKIRDQDKLNYRLEIGSRVFKCTTIPIFRQDYGLVGAICINVDANFIHDEVISKKEKLEAFIENIVKTDFKLDENILSQEEYRAAMEGKRHFADDVLLAGNRYVGHKRLMAIMFSDIVGYSALMGKSEPHALSILDENRRYHGQVVHDHHGQILKEIGDGTLAGFNSASEAVDCGIAIQQRVRQSTNYQLRIGIHLGEVHTSNNDVFGDGVNIASRIQSTATPGSVAMSEVVYDNIKNKMKVAMTFAGEKRLKNIAEPVRIYEIHIDN